MDLVGELHRRSPLYLTREQFEATLVGWNVEPVEQDGRVIGCFVVKGPEIHFAKFDDTPVTREHLKRLDRVITEHGFARTRTPKDDLRQCRFNARLRGRIVGETEYDVIYEFEHRD